MPYGWIFSMGTGKDVVDSSAFGKNAQKSPEALHFRGIFSCTPGRSRTCDLQSRSLTLYPTELRALISLIILPQQGRIVKRKCGKIAGRDRKKSGKVSARARSGGKSAIEKYLPHFLRILGGFLKKCRLTSSQMGKNCYNNTRAEDAQITRGE